MKRKIATALLTALISMTLVAGQPAAARGRGCAEFGHNISFLATSFGVGFGQMAASTAPLNDTVEREQQALCN